jgi:hypothetical protein
MTHPVHSVLIEAESMKESLDRGLFVLGVHAGIEESRVEFLFAQLRPV